MSEVAVVIPWFEQQEQLDLVLAALELQTLPPAEVVVADDGSSVPPRLGQRAYPVRAVRQEDEGFRASAARALGAAATSARVLVFLDADTVPEPGCLAALAALVDDGPRGAVVVGRRRHADLRGWSPDRVRAWFAGGPAPDVLDEPRWLADAYAQTDDLRRADDRSYRFVISALLALPRELYDAAGGFDPGFVGYGGEDWDLAHRCWLAGAELRHAPGAVAWHDGPDLAGRTDPEALRAAKDAETLQLAHVLTDPLARGAGLQWRYPHTVVVLPGRPAPGDLAACASSLLAGRDAALWCPDLDALPPALADQPRLHAGPVPPDVRCRARLLVELPGPVLGELPDEPGDVELAAGDVIRVRSLRRLALGDDSAPRRAGDQVPLAPGPALEARWAGWA